MSIWNEDSGYYCLLIAILCEVDVTEAKLIYKYGPGHPVSRRIFDKKLKVEDAENMEKEKYDVPDAEGRIYAGGDFQRL